MFTCFVNYDESEENKVGAFRIMDLPEFDLFDGVICMKNSIQYEPTVNSLIARIKKSKVPAVSVDEKVDGMQRIAEDIKAAIKTDDQKENRSYHLAASLGCSLHKSYEMDNLNSLIELADKKMYEEKKNKRR